MQEAEIWYSMTVSTLMLTYTNFLPFFAPHNTSFETKINYSNMFFLGSIFASQHSVSSTEIM
jgi:hypothetical protein